MMNEHPYFHWDLLRQPLQTPQFGMAPSFFDVNSILELRKEKSRDAARSRRGKENYEFYELAKLLPLPAAITSQLDKASIIRLTISYLKLRNFSTHGDPQWTSGESGVGSMGTSCKNGKVLPGHRRMDMLDPFESQHGTHILQSLDGFAFILANDGRFLYISETVSIYLGLSQVEMAGSSIFDYVHQDDHGELTENLGMCSVPASGPANSPPSSGSDEAASPGQRSQTPSERGYSMVHQWDKSSNKSFCIRMKSTLTKRGAHVKTSGYRVLHILGTLRPQSIFGIAQGTNNQSPGSTGGDGGTNNNTDAPPMGLVGMAFALPPPTISELRMEMDTFILRLSPGFRVTYCDPPLSDLMDLTPDDVNERMLYDLCHVADLKLLQQAHNDIMTKGQALTDYWRMMNRHGGYTWMQTFATTLFNNKTPEDQTILAINYVISGVRSAGCCEDLWQVTGDVTSSMSSTYRSPARDQLLKGLQRNDSRKDEGSTSSCNNKAAEKLSTSSKINEKDKSEHTETRSTSSSSKESKKLKHSVSSTTASAGKTEEDTSKDYNGASSLDSKNNRRKMDNPRKRKKSEDEPENSFLSRKTLHNSRPEPMPKTSLPNSCYDRTPGSKGNTLPVGSFPSLNTPMFNSDTTTSSSSPEDLSVKKPSPPLRVTDSLEQHLTSTEVNVNNGKSIPTLEPQSDQITSPRIQSIQNQVTNSSVNQLEAAMNRHLQTQALDCKMTSNEESSYGDKSSASGGASTTGHKLPQMPPLIAHGGHQWIPPSARTPPATTGDILPTSDLLRSLYTTRESVIKTNARSHNQNSRNSSSSSSSSSSYLNGETPSSLLTPPEPDPSSEISSTGKSQSQLRTQSHVHTKRSEAESSQANNTLQYFSSNLNLHQSIKGSNNFDERETFYKDSNSFKDQVQFLPYKDPLSYIDHFATGYKDHMTSYKDFPPFKDIVPAFTIPNLVSPGGRFQNPYPSLTHHFSFPMTPTIPSQNVAPGDPCSMTPPASNSPDVAGKSNQNLTHHQTHHPQTLHHHQQHHPPPNPSLHALSTLPSHQTFNDNPLTTTYSTDTTIPNSENTNFTTHQLTNSKHQLTPNEIAHPPQNLDPNQISTSAPSPSNHNNNNNITDNSGYSQYRHQHHHHHHPNHYAPQDYSSSSVSTPSSFYPTQDLTKTGGYYGMAPTPMASMYMELNNSASSHYDMCHRPTLTWY